MQVIRYKAGLFFVKSIEVGYWRKCLRSREIGKSSRSSAGDKVILKGNDCTNKRSDEACKQN